MASKLVDSIASVGSQKDDRELATVRDQHKCARFPEGRPWWGYIETPANPKEIPSFVTELQPGDHEDPYNSGWDSPWRPAPKFMKIDTRKGRVTLDYGSIINEYERSRREYYDLCVETAYEKGWAAPEYGGPVDHKYRALHGPIPPSPKIPQAALAGDPYILGFSPVCDDDMLRDALVNKHVRAEPIPVREYAAVPESPVSNALVMTPEELQAKIMEAVDAALLKKSQERMAKARDAKKAA